MFGSTRGRLLVVVLLAGLCLLAVTGASRYRDTNNRQITYAAILNTKTATLEVEPSVQSSSTPRATVEPATPTLTPLPPSPTPTVTATPSPTINPVEEVVASLLPLIEENGQAGAKEAIPLLGRALQERGILDRNTYAYLLATVWHETVREFRPIEERHGLLQGETRNYNGGPDFYGRGYCQITGKWVYDPIGQQLGLDLSGHKELLLDPWVSAQSCAAYFDWRGTATLASQGDFLNARSTINGNDIQTVGREIAAQAERYLSVLPDQSQLEIAFR